MSNVQQERGLRDATGPVEHRAPGNTRESTNILISTPDQASVTRVADIASVLPEGALLVLNNSQTLPASVAVRDQSLRVNFGTIVGDGLAYIEVRNEGANGATSPRPSPSPADTFVLRGGLSVEVAHTLDSHTQQVLGRFGLNRSELTQYLLAFGEPIRYPYVAARWDLDAYQTPLGSILGSSEMPSASRAITRELLEKCEERDISSVQLTLHTGLSSDDEPVLPLPERVRVMPDCVASLRQASAEGRPIIAVGTTVVRALAESMRRGNGTFAPASGLADVVVTPESDLSWLAGIVTGWHAAGSSHRQMLRALVGEDQLLAAYTAALATGLLSHEFGDLCLLMP